MSDGQMAQNAGGEVSENAATEAEIDALEILLADHYPLEKGAVLVAAMRRNGQDPVATARHFIKLRRAARGEK